jgi:hypothetical protein
MRESQEAIADRKDAAVVTVDQAVDCPHKRNQRRPFHLIER